MKGSNDKVDNVQKQMSNASRDRKTLNNNQKHGKNQNELTEIKNAFDGFIIRWDMVKERISEPEDSSIETSHTEMKREKKKK